MSLIAWMEEYCPENAQDCVDRKATDIELVEHGLRKWRGLSYDNLVRHRLVEDKNGNLVDGDSGERMLVDWSTCALCLTHLHDGQCTTCPLAIVRGGISCDEKVDGEELSPYGQWFEWRGPDSMILLLEKAKKWLTERAEAGSRLYGTTGDEAPCRPASDNPVMPATWLVRALVALAKRALADDNSTCGEFWPAGQKWHELGHSSKHAFIARALADAGIPKDDYRRWLEEVLATGKGADELEAVWEELAQASAREV